MPSKSHFLAHFIPGMLLGSVVGLAFGSLLVAGAIPRSYVMEENSNDSIEKSGGERVMGPKEGYTRYSHSTLGYTFDYPENWKMAEYSSSGPDIMVAVDPLKVSTEAEYMTLDMAPGRVWIFAEGARMDRVPGLLDAQIGAAGLSAKVAIDRQENDGPNPAWQNMTDKRYFVDLPEEYKANYNESITIAVAYPNSLENDVAAQAELRAILDSIRFVSAAE